jgi:peptide-methionine (S)-S-oxide reductase
VGYTGGTKLSPTYHSLGDHTESIQIDYDPNEISYEELLNVFWRSHDPTQRAWSRQYKAAVFYHDAEQKAAAEKTRDREASQKTGQIVTEILPATAFYTAEPYHQKFRLQQNRALSLKIREVYPSFEDFVNSTAAARLNAYLDGRGTPEFLREELEKAGLPSEIIEELMAYVDHREKSRK